MGLPLWSSVGYNDENKSPSRAHRRIFDSTKLARSPIRRRVEYTDSRTRLQVTRRPLRHLTPIVRDADIALSIPIPLSNAPNAPNDHVTMAPYLATLMRASIVLQVAIDRGSAIRIAIDQLLPYLENMPEVNRDIRDCCKETDSIYEIHSAAYRAMRLLDQNLICTADTTHVRENLRRCLEHLTYALTRATDRPTHFIHRILQTMAGMNLCDEARNLVIRTRVSLPIIRFSSVEFQTLNDRDTGEADFPPLERVNARDEIPVAYARPLSSEPSTRTSTPLLPSEPLVTAASGLGDRSRSISTEPNESGPATWDTMLTTIEPDEHLPTAASSFVAEAASQSFSQDLRSAGNTQHDDFLPMFRTRRYRNPQPTEPLIQESLIGTNRDPRFHVSRVRRSRPSLPSINHLSTYSPPPQQLGPGALARLSRMRNQRRAARPASPPPDSDTTPEVIDSESGPNPPLSPPSTNSPLSDSFSHPPIQPVRRTYDPLSHPELSHMRTILAGMAQSDNVPDDWWSSAGLTPYVLGDESQPSDEVMIQDQFIYQTRILPRYRDV